MPPIQQPTKTVELSMDQIILSIRDIRDDQIDQLLNESTLMSFLEQYYNTVAISNLKKRFLFKDLIELKNSQLDLSHYATMITQLKDLKTSIADPKHPLFLTELKTIFKKYVSVS